MVVIIGKGKSRVGTISNISSMISAAPLKSSYSQKLTTSTYFWAPNLKIGCATEEYALLTSFINKKRILLIELYITFFENLIFAFWRSKSVFHQKCCKRNLISSQKFTTTDDQKCFFENSGAI